MRLTKDDLEKYKKIYFEQYWEEISDAEALEQGTALIWLMKMAIKWNDDLI